MNLNLLLLIMCQGLLLTHNVTFMAVNGRVGLLGLSLAPSPWMAILPITGTVAGCLLCASRVARCQRA